MSRQGSRAPVGLGIGGGVLVLGLAAYATVRTLGLRDLPRVLAGPAALIDRTAAPSRPTAVPSAAPGPVPLSPDVLFARSLPAVVRINVQDLSNKPLGHGTGFFVSGDGLVVTNFHVIDGAASAMVERTDGSVLLVDGVATLDRVTDLVLLKVNPARAGEAFPTLPLAFDELPRVGTKVYAIGHPLGLKNVLSEGLVSSLGDPARGQRFIQTTAANRPGSSGGPLMTPDGVVVGVTTATVREAQNVNFAMPAGRVRWLLAQPREPSPLPLAKVAKPAGPGPESAAAVDRALDSVWDAMRADRLSEAARLVNELRERGKGNAYYWFTCGCVHTKLHNDDLAVEAFRASLKLKPDKLATYLNLGQVYTRQRKLADAIATYETAAKLEPGDPRAYAQAGDAYATFDQYARAIPFYRKAVALQPNSADHRHGLGVAYSSAGRTTEALECLRKAVELEPDGADHHRDLGIALLEIRRYNDALSEIRRAVALKPDSAESYLFLGYAHQSLGNRQAALDAWRNADRFDSPAGKAGKFARRALAEAAANEELTIPGRR
jgi:S1-C subfamily serine protease/tetratricopeptide (TPR) repeat protein